MKVERTTAKDELNLREVAKFLNLDYKKLERDGQVKQILETGVSKAMPVTVMATLKDKQVDLKTTARLAMGADKEGKPTVNIVFKQDKPQLERYRDIVLDGKQQEDLRKGKTLVVRDTSDREHIIKFDRELNKIGGMKKSAFLSPEQLGSPKTGYTKLNNSEKASLKKGDAIEVEIGGKKMKAQLDPIERKLNIKSGPSQSQDLKAVKERKVGPKPSL